MSRFLFTALLLGVLASTVSLTGCNSEKATATPNQQAQMKVLGILYGQFLSINRGQAPADDEQFIEYLESKRPSWEKIVDSADQMILSPRDGKPLVMLYGNRFRKQASEGTMWMAYEQEGIEGQHQVLSIRGDVKEMDSQQIEQLFSK